MGEPAGFSEYVAGQRNALVRVAYLLTGDGNAAEDLVQTALVRVWPRWSKVVQGHNADAYVRKTLMSVFLNSRRRRWRGELAAEALEYADPSDPYAGLDEADRMMRYLRLLPRRQRAVIVLRYYADLGEADVADLLGCAVGTVKSQSAKALGTLRELLARADERGGA
ncbi:MAG: sig38 [Actinoallomurus sp.]|nr:sig38 [Actinoallomurus sp.]